MGYNVVEIEKENGLKLTIWQDEGFNPREDYDNFGTMMCSHGRYSLGDTTFDSKKYSGWEEALRGEAGSLDKIIYLPLYLYDHSGITMNTTGFSCPWDSGQVGWIYVTKENVRKEYGVKRITKEIMEKALSLLKAEVETYDDYITGSVYGFTLEDSENDVDDSCGGFFGTNSIEYMKEHVDKEYHHLFDEAMNEI